MLVCLFLDFFPTPFQPIHCHFHFDCLQVEDSEMAASGTEATGTEQEQPEEDQPSEKDCENAPVKKEAQIPKSASKGAGKAKAAVAPSSNSSSQSAIAALFNSSGKGKPGGKGKRGGASNKEVSKSDAVATDAGQLLQMFDEPSEIFGVSNKKMEDVLEKIKGRTGRSIYSVVPSSKAKSFLGQGVRFR